ncbi:MAG: Flp pilus assembly complex ATPase component TadA [Cyanobacteria bacterium]|nr:Flp pilus assembly complex ATPase component TadA [Cyanobacteriota bacterium]
MSSPSAPNNRPDYKRIGELLIEAGVISEADVAEALVESKKAGVTIGHALIRTGKITREQLGKALSIQFGTKYINLANTEVDPILLELLPEDFIRLKRAMPIGKEAGRLVVAMVDPRDRSVIDEITFITGMRPQVVVTTTIEFQETLNRYFSNRTSSTLMDDISTATASADTDAQASQLQEDVVDPTNPLIKLVNSILEEAVNKNASDIHIEPRQKKYVVRFRIDGILRSILDIPTTMESSFITRLKVMARMDIAEHRRPQDGRILLKAKNIDYNLRVNTLPVGENREKMVIRILRPFEQIVDFTDLGFEQEEIRKLERLYKTPYGIILVCGPTGSGKTTSLYTMLHKINDDYRNISTVEDPVELQIEGLNQSQVNPKADYTFATSMRALLRQDPDVIMVGEIRDYETLEAAIHAALTGHLVFSTIHSNTTSATVTRLVEMGAATSLIGTALVGIIAQRLVRKICNSCKYQYKASDEEKRILFPYDDDRAQQDIVLAKGKGCDYCGNTGYNGRTGLYEILMLDREIRHLIGENSSDLEIEDAAIAAGMRTLAMSGRVKAISGVTTIDELVRVLGVNLGA